MFLCHTFLVRRRPHQAEVGWGWFVRSGLLLPLFHLLLSPAVFPTPGEFIARVLGHLWSNSHTCQEATAGRREGRNLQLHISVDAETLIFSHVYTANSPYVRMQTPILQFYTKCVVSGIWSNNLKSKVLQFLNYIFHYYFT